MCFLGLFFYLQMLEDLGGPGVISLLARLFSNLISWPSPIGPRPRFSIPNYRPMGPSRDAARRHIAGIPQSWLLLLGVLGVLGPLGVRDFGASPRTGNVPLGHTRTTTLTTLPGCNPRVWVIALYFVDPQMILRLWFWRW